MILCCVGLCLVCIDYLIVKIHSYHQAWISRNKLKSKLRLKSEILLKFEKSKKNAFLEKKISTNFNSTWEKT
jgi:hypothetical protein